MATDGVPEPGAGPATPRPADALRAELADLRRYLRESGCRRWFVAGGAGQHGLWWSEGGAHASRWTATLEAGLEWRPGERWLFQAVLVNRALEYSGGSFSGSGLLITCGARFDT